MGSWEVDSGLQDGGLSPSAWFQQHGYLRWLVDQPADRFWTFQAVEAAIFLGLSAVLVVVMFALVRRA